MPTAEAPSSIHLVTASSSDSNEYHLLQLPEEVLAEIEEKQRRQTTAKRKGRDDEGDAEEEEEGHLLTINGRHGDEAVICTRSRTYALRQITQSNTLLLCSLPSLDPIDESGGAVVRSNVSDMLEMVPVMPRLQRIGTLLHESRFEGEEEEERQLKARLYTPTEVRSIVQTSTHELQTGLDSHHVVLLDGFYRMVSRDYLFLALESLLNHVDLHAYQPTSIPLTATLEALAAEHEIRNEVGYALLTRWFGKPLSEAPAHVALDSDAIVRFLGKRLLAVDARQPVLLEEWQNKWKKSVGQTFAEHVDLSKIKGEFLLFPTPPSQPTSAQPLRIQYYPKDTLPLDPAQRFQDLFLTRPQWLLDDLLPYLDDVAVDKKKRDALLLKFARTNRIKVPAAPPVESTKPPAKKSKVTSQAIEMKELTLYSARVRC